jgi:Cu-Zn family superoxide dismutase
MRAAAVFTGPVVGTVTLKDTSAGCQIRASFSHMPPGDHGFHIHAAGDLRGVGCQGACSHYHVGAPSDHGAGPQSKGPRHTGDLGNISLAAPNRHFLLKDVTVADLYGRSLIVHEDPDDLGQTDHPESKTTGNSGKRIGCALIGRVECKLPKPRQTRKTHKQTTLKTD